MARPSRLRVSHLRDSKFAKRGLRSYFEYRDLGIKRATGGKVVAHVCSVQFVYVLKGWVRFEYEGVGEVLMKAGSCFYQPPRIRHRELEHSPDVEMLEVVAPADFKTYSVEKRAGGRSPARRSRG
jgi:mannose-6-phosphate isomerase-like protein (cupin superfamily)